jgi:6-phosphogluconolactonase
MIVYVGTYTGQGRAEGIYVYRMDPASGALSPVQTVGGLNSPTFLALHPQRPFLYAVERQWSEEGRSDGVVSAFAIDERTGALTLLNRQSSQGVSPCYVSVHPSGRYAFAANYASGHVAALPIQADGTLGEATSAVHHEGSGPVARRQEGPHAHFVAPDPSGRYVLACDLGIDKVMVYRFDLTSGQLIPNDPPFGRANPGAGPRHLSFHPSGRFVYVINELDSTVSAYAYDGQRGTLELLQTVSTLPEGFAETNHPAQIVVHPSGRFVYGSNRGHDSIAIFAIDQETGRVAFIGHEPTQGKTPRNFNLDPSGTLLLAANQGSDTIVPFRIDQERGTLTPTGHVTQTPNPVCIVFRPQ